MKKSKLFMSCGSRVAVLQRPEFEKKPNVLDHGL